MLKKVVDAYAERDQFGDYALWRRNKSRYGAELLTCCSRGAMERMRMPGGEQEAILVGVSRGLSYWSFGGHYFGTQETLSADDVVALAMEVENRKRLRLEKAHALRAMREQLDHKTKRDPIPSEIRVSIWQRDGGRCAECGDKENLEFDHVIPLAMGGSNTERNLQLLCASCNRRKGATLG